jgi:hypothetical protein
MDNEVAVLKRLRKPALPGDEKFFMHLPEITDTLSGAGGRRVNVFARRGQLVPLAEIIAAFPGGVDPRDAVWMWRRGLRAIGYLRLRNIVHGAITPSHLLMDLQDHGLVLAGWTAAIESGKSVKIVDTTYRALYPPEILAKKPQGHTTDMYMLAKSMVLLLGGDPKTNSIPKEVPPPMGRLLRGCMMDAPQHRLDNAWWLHDEIKNNLIDWFGPRKFRVFTMPSR